MDFIRKFLMNFWLFFRAIHKSNMENLILYCGNKAQGDERIMNILEIVVLILREQVCQSKRNINIRK